MADRSPDPCNPLVDDRAIANHGMEGRYTNYFLVGHNVLEFVIDFGQQYNGNHEQMHSRIVMIPSYAKELLRVLSKSIESYEGQFGDIQEVDAKVPAERPAPL